MDVVSLRIRCYCEAQGVVASQLIKVKNEDWLLLLFHHSSVTEKYNMNWMIMWYVTICFFFHCEWKYLWVVNSWSKTERKGDTLSERTNPRVDTAVMSRTRLYWVDLQVGRQRRSITQAGKSLRNKKLQEKEANWESGRCVWQLVCGTRLAGNDNNEQLISLNVDNREDGEADVTCPYHHICFSIFTNNSLNSFLCYLLLMMFLYITDTLELIL